MVSRSPNEFMERCGLKEPAPGPGPRLDTRALLVRHVPLPEGTPRPLPGLPGEPDPLTDRAGMPPTPPA